MLFPHIGRLRDVQRRAEANNVHYRPKVKLHGTHGAISIHGGEVGAFSRNRRLDSDSDNFGFFAWVQTQKSKLYPSKYDRVIFGEWCGEGVQKGVAISQVPKFFAVFAVEHDGAFISEPWAISALIDDLEAYVIPWYGPRVHVGALDLNAIDEEVARIDVECPWTREVLGVTGRGEGLVFYPDDTYDIHDFATYAWKAKGASHTSTPGARPRLPLPPEVDAFVALAMHPARLEQAVQETGPCVPQNTGAFLKWLGNDVERELAPELEAAGLTWKQVAKQLSRKAAQWYRLQTTSTS